MAAPYRPRRRVAEFRFILAVLLLACRPPSAHAVDVNARQLRELEKRAFEAGDGVVETLVAVSARGLDCDDCRKAFMRMVRTMTAARAEHRAAVLGTEADKSISGRRKRELRHAAAARAEEAYAALAAELGVGGSLCGKCAPTEETGRMVVMRDIFGSPDRGQAVVSALGDALALLRRASTAMQRRLYDPGFRTKVDGLFNIWMAKPTGANTLLVSDRIDGLLMSLILKHLDPGAFFRYSTTYTDPKIKEISKTPGLIAFVVPGEAHLRQFIFINSEFFVEPRSGGVILHEESHLLYNTTDKGMRGVRRHRGRAAMDDAYALESLVVKLNEM